MATPGSYQPRPKILQRDVDSVLKEVRFSSKEHGPWKVIGAHGNETYFATRAIEAIGEKQYVLAIRLLVIAIWTRKTSDPKQDQKPSAKKR